MYIVDLNFKVIEQIKKISFSAFAKEMLIFYKAVKVWFLAFNKRANISFGVPAVLNKILPSSYALSKCLVQGVNLFNPKDLTPLLA